MRNRITPAIAIIVIAAAGCRGGAEGETAPGAAGVAVTTVAARLGTIRDAIVAQGTVVPSAIADFLVTAPEPGEIAELTVNEGDIVKAGDLLVRLEIPSVTNELATRQLELIDAQSRLDAARKDFERQSKLFEQGIASRNAWDNARLALSSAEANLSGMKTKFEAAKSLEDRAIIRARFTGVVTKRFKIQGQSVAGGEADPIMRVVDTTKLQVVTQVSISESARIQPGQSAQVQTGLGPEAAIVAMKAPPATVNATNVDVRLNFVAPTTIPIDTPVQIEIVIEERKDVLVVPAEVVKKIDGGAFVWVVNTNNQATRRDVGTGKTSGNVTEITSGLAVGDAVIATGLAQLEEGMAVVVSGK